MPGRFASMLAKFILAAGLAEAITRWALSGFKPAKVLFYVADVRDPEADKHALVFSFRSNLSCLRPPWSSHSAGSRSGGGQALQKTLAVRIHCAE
jgi:hypothetical protein